MEMVDWSGVPLAAVLTDAQVHDSTVFEGVDDGVEAVTRDRRGGPGSVPTSST
jgi:DMSO/TMAO reductase YedYZ molybdopterin-dependent catalytic subunit